MWGPPRGPVVEIVGTCFLFVYAMVCAVHPACLDLSLVALYECDWICLDVETQSSAATEWLYESASGWIAAQVEYCPAGAVESAESHKRHGLDHERAISACEKACEWYKAGVEIPAVIFAAASGEASHKRHGLVHERAISACEKASERYMAGVEIPAAVFADESGEASHKRHGLVY